jgi:crooked neck
VQSYIDFEIAEGERERTRELYERLLQRTRHVKVWMSYASFEASPLPEPEGEEAAEPDSLANRPEEAPEHRETVARRYRWTLWQSRLKTLFPRLFFCCFF